MSIAPLPDLPAVGMTPGFGLNPGFGVAAPHTEATQGVEGVGGAQGVESFGQLLASKLDDLNAVQQRSDELAVKAATGDLQDVHEYTTAAGQAQVATQLVVAVRNKAVESFNEIMRMQL